MSKRVEEEDKKYIEIIMNMILDGNWSDMEHLGEDDEEWTPQAIHDDGHLDSSDESVALMGMEVEVPTRILDIIRNASVMGDAKRK